MHRRLHTDVDGSTIPVSTEQLDAMAPTDNRDSLTVVVVSTVALMRQT